MKLINRIYIVVIVLCFLANNEAKATVTKSIILNSPGTLSTYFSASERSSVTKLILSGTMNVEDFTFIRIFLDKLAVLDMRNATPDKAEIPEEALCWGAGATFLDTVFLPTTLTKIGARAFSECDHLRKVDFPSTLTDIGEEAFEGCSKLDSVSIPSALANWGESVFSGCASLKSVTFMQGLSMIGASAFEWCESLQAIQIPTSVKYIGQGAFNSCVELNSVLLSEGLDSLGIAVFAFCTKLDTIVIPASVKSIGVLAFMFSNCSMSVASENKCLKVEEGILYNHDMTVLLECPTFKTGTVVVPETVDTIEMGGFGYCSLLSEIILPPRLRAIKGYGLCYCLGLQSMVIPDSVSFIGSAAFAGIPMIQMVSSGNPYFIVVDSVLFDKTMTRLIHYPILKSGSYVMPASVEILACSSFERCIGLTSITLSSNLKIFEEDVFYGCDALKSIYLTNSKPIELDPFFLYELQNDCTFYVPRGSLNDYLKADVWSELFLNLKEWDLPTNISALDNQEVRIGLTNVELIIYGAKAGTTISVYSINGDQFKNLKTAESGEIPLPLFGKGVWLVKVGNKTYKVIN